MSPPDDTVADTAPETPDADLGPGSRSRGPASVWVVSGLAVLALTAAPHSTSAQRCETVTGAAADSARQTWRERNAFRDTVRRILVEAGAFDSAAAVRVLTDTVERRTDVTFEGIDPPAEARHRIRAYLADFFGDRPPEARQAAVDFDAPVVAPPPGSFERCSMLALNNEHLNRVVREMVETYLRDPDREGESGEWSALLRLYVDWRADVAQVVVTEASGEPWFDHLLELLGREMEFEPATVAGTPHGMWVLRRVVFKIER